MSQTAALTSVWLQTTQGRGLPGLEAPFTCAADNSSLLELSHSLCHIVTVALVSCSTPIGPHVYHLTHERSLLWHTAEYCGIKAGAHFQSDTPAGSQEKWELVFPSHSMHSHFLEKYQRPVRTHSKETHPTLPCQSFHLCTCLTAPPYVTHSSAQQTQTVRDADVALHCMQLKPNKTCHLLSFISSLCWLYSGKKMLQPDTLNFHKWITELTVKDNNSSRHHSILQIYFYGGKQSLTCFWAALKPLTTLFRCASSKNLKNDA